MNETKKPESAEPKPNAKPVRVWFDGRNMAYSAEYDDGTVLHDFNSEEAACIYYTIQYYNKVKDK